jgi:GntR family transcriptional regulator of arabinose operon
MPRYYQVYASLQERIRAGEFLPGQQLPTERQLGEEYNVSRITVVKALDLLKLEGSVERQQGRGTFVIQPLGEPLSPSAPGVASPVALVCPITIDNPYLSSILTGIAGVLAQHSLPLLVYGFIDDSAREAAAIEDALARGVQGLIIYPWLDYYNVALYRRIQSLGLPLVYLDRYYPELDTDHVIWDDKRYAYESTCYLISRGHRRIAFVSTAETRPTSMHDRLMGYRQALAEHGLDDDEDLVWLDMAAAFPSFHAGPDISDSLIRHLAEDRVTALLTVNDGPAHAIARVLQSLSASASPLSQSATQIDIATISPNYPTHRLPYVSLVGIQRGDVLGAEAARLLVGRLHGTLPPDAQHVVKSISIVECGSDHTCVHLARHKPAKEE